MVKKRYVYIKNIQSYTYTINIFLIYAKIIIQTHIQRRETETQSGRGREKGPAPPDNDGRSWPSPLCSLVNVHGYCFNLGDSSADIANWKGLMAATCQVSCSECPARCGTTFIILIRVNPRMWQRMDTWAYKYSCNNEKWTIHKAWCLYEMNININNSVVEGQWPSRNANVTLPRIHHGWTPVAPVGKFTTKSRRLLNLRLGGLCPRPNAHAKIAP